MLVQSINPILNGGIPELDLCRPVIAEADENSPAFARIYKEMILATRPGKPMIWAPKGTMVRKATIALYTEDIEALYNLIEDSRDAAGEVEPPASWTPRDIKPLLIAHARLRADREIRGDQNLFEQGFDSLSVTFLRHCVVGALRNATLEAGAKAELELKIPQNFVYAHPSIEQLAGAIARIVSGEPELTDTRKKAILERMIAKYGQGDPPTVPDPDSDSCRSSIAGITSARLDQLWRNSFTLADESDSGSGVVDTSPGFEVVIHDMATISSRGAVILLSGSMGALGSHILEMLLGESFVMLVSAFNRRGRTQLCEHQREAFVERGPDGKLLSLETLVYLEGEADLGLPAEVLNAVMGGMNAEEVQLDPSVALDTVKENSRSIWSPGEFLPNRPNLWVYRKWGLVDHGPGACHSEIQRLHPVPWRRSLQRLLLIPSLMQPYTEYPAFAINLVHPHPIVFSSTANVAGLPLIPFEEWVERLQTCSAHASGADIEIIPGIKLLDFFAMVVSGEGDVFNCQSTRSQ
ncbi:hypothetical protein DFH07DRAFT_771484 [Mycena maculata]|uniref:Polyketide synthase-like phosphopantetheine-binding domain-containing protein n=1 Tax=Mycena maculata TaxID=230809 RepID=A0AAD7JCN5_9AGAR|nr:hypothetical protein DFH07DRAFT_771484 [Mycena maculata]